MGLEERQPVGEFDLESVIPLAVMGIFADKPDPDAPLTQPRDL